MKAEMKSDGSIVLTPETGAEAFACARLAKPTCTFDMTNFPEAARAAHAEQWAKADKLFRGHPFEMPAPFRRD